MAVTETQSDVVFDAANRLVKLGVSVIPIEPGTKEPPEGFRWGQFATRIADASERYEWFVEKGYQLAVVTGPVSGDLVILDFDSITGYPTFSREHPEIVSFPRVRTGSGKYHVWLRPTVPTRKYVTHGPDGGNLEIRAGTHYTLVPPSRHPDGGMYVWEVEPINDIPTIDLRKIGLRSKAIETVEPGDPIEEGKPLAPHEIDHIIEFIVPHYIPYSRHEICLALAGWLSGHGVPEADARTIVKRLAIDSGDTGRLKEFLRGVRTTYARSRQGIAVAGWSRLTSRDDPLISPSTGKQSDCTPTRPNRYAHFRNG